MGGYRKLNKAELRQRAADQLNPEWLAWRMGMDEPLQRFFTVDVPDMPADPFSSAGLAHAEHALIAMFASADPLLELENAAVADRFQRYVGEAFARSFEGQWMNVRVSDDPDSGVFFDRRGFAPAVYRPFNGAFVDVVSMVLMAAHRRTGQEWTFVYGHSASDHVKWVAKGRKPL